MCRVVLHTILSVVVRWSCRRDRLKLYRQKFANGVESGRKSWLGWHGTCFFEAQNLKEKSHPLCKAQTSYTTQQVWLSHHEADAAATEVDEAVSAEVDVVVVIADVAVDEVGPDLLLEGNAGH